MTPSWSNQLPPSGQAGIAATSNSDGFSNHSPAGGAHVVVVPCLAACRRFSVSQLHLPAIQDCRSQGDALHTQQLLRPLHSLGSQACKGVWFSLTPVKGLLQRTTLADLTSMDPTGLDLLQQSSHLIETPRSKWSRHLHYCFRHHQLPLLRSRLLRCFILLDR